MGFNFKNALRKILPTAAAALGGPFGPAAASAVGALLGKPDAKEDEIPELVNKAIATDPDIVFKLRQLETGFAERMASMGFDDIEKLEALAVDDRKDARAREIAIKDKIPAILAICVTAALFGLVFLLCYHAVPEANQRPLDILLGTMVTGWIGVMTYYFGSSAGSREAGRTISRTIDNLATTK